MIPLDSITCAKNREYPIFFSFNPDGGQTALGFVAGHRGYRVLSVCWSGTHTSVSKHKL